MRGKRCADVVNLGSTGITPADAGKTKHKLAVTLLREDHPRGCGENVKNSLVMGRQDGSPPRMRGKPAVSDAHRLQPRITPADAGKTKHRPFDKAYPRDHPRGCGENQNSRAILQ